MRVLTSQGNQYTHEEVLGHRGFPNRMSLAFFSSPFVRFYKCYSCRIPFFSAPLPKNDIWQLVRVQGNIAKHTSVENYPSGHDEMIRGFFPNVFRTLRCMNSRTIRDLTSHNPRSRHRLHRRSYFVYSHPCDSRTGGCLDSEGMLLPQVYEFVLEQHFYSRLKVSRINNRLKNNTVT